MLPQVAIFTKNNCSYCERAKSILNKAGLPATEFNIEDNVQASDLCTYFSGLATVPQVFIGKYRINGANDLEALSNNGRLGEIVESAGHGTTGFDAVDHNEASGGARDFPLRDVIPQADGTRDTDEETLPILHFYKDFFGFWPLTYRYLYHWREAYKAVVIGHIMANIQCATMTMGNVYMRLATYATTNAHGCEYCTIHAAGIGGSEGGDIIRWLTQARGGRVTEDNPFGDLELALADLSAQATLNSVTEETIEKIKNLASGSALGPKNADQLIGGVTLSAAFMGFLNVFNDLTALKVEGDWARAAADNLGIDAGRHGMTDENPNDLDFELPASRLSLPEVAARLQAGIGDPGEYSIREFGMLPGIFKIWPEISSGGFAYAYGEVMGDRPHAHVPAELKHLMARVAAISKGHETLAAEEARMAHHASTDKEASIGRIRHCYRAATDFDGDYELFNEKEIAALRIAWLSAQIPLVTPARYVKPAVAMYSAKELIELFTVCGIASSTQRVSAIIRPPLNREVKAFCVDNGIDTDVIELRYPVPA